MNSKKIVLGFFAGLLICPLQLASTTYIWDKEKNPSSSYDCVRKIALGSALAGCTGGAIGALRGRGTAFLAGFTGLIIGGLLGKNSSDKNSPDLWLKDFSAAFNELELISVLAEGDRWLAGYDLRRDAQQLQKNLEQTSIKIIRLQEVSQILLALSLLQNADFRLDIIRVWKNECQKRLTQVSILIDSTEFHKNYTSFIHSAILRKGPHKDSWMLKDGQKSSYQDLFVDCTKAVDLLKGLKDKFSTRLMSQEYSFFLTNEDKADFSQKMLEANSLEEVLMQRSEFSLAQWEHQTFSSKYEKLASLDELKPSASRNDAWLKIYSSRKGEDFSIKKLQEHLNRLSSELRDSLTIGQKLLRASTAKNLSLDEQSTVTAKILALQDLTTTLYQRQQILRGLQIVEAFNARYVSAISPTVARPSSFGANDLSWMQVHATHRWPLQEVHRLLDACRGPVTDTFKIGSDFLNHADFNALSAHIKSDFATKVLELQKILELIDMRLLFLINSTMYAQEVRAKVKYEEEQRERARLERESIELQRQQEKQRRDDERLAHQINRQQQEEKRRLEREKAAQIKNDERIAREQEELKQQAQQSHPTTPSFNVSPAAAASTVPLVPAAIIPPKPDVPVPALPIAEAEECYLCLDSDNIADCTTSNCDCTVKKAACRGCLQDWINRNHTCPNCRKAGAIVVPLRS